MQTLTILVVCLYVFHTASSEETSTTAQQTASTTPTPSLECSSNGTLTYKGIPEWVQSAKSSCGTATVNKSPKTIVIDGCTVGHTATVFMYKTSAVPTPKAILKGTEDKVTVIAISCTYTVNGVYHVTMKFPGSVSPTPFTAKEPIALTMSLTNLDDTSKPTTVVIGDKYSLHIKGGGNHYMKILTCKAAGEQSLTNAVTVYNANTTDGDKLGIISPLNGTSASGAGPHPLKATLTGFRLVNSLTVYLECSVKVCDTPNCTSHKRTRTKSSLKTASLKFEVVSTQSPRHANGAREINTSGKFTLTFAMVILARYITFK